MLTDHTPSPTWLLAGFIGSCLWAQASLLLIFTKYSHCLQTRVPMTCRPVSLWWALYPARVTAEICVSDAARAVRVISTDARASASTPYNVPMETDQPHVSTLTSMVGVGFAFLIFKATRLSGTLICGIKIFTKSRSCWCISIFGLIYYSAYQGA